MYTLVTGWSGVVFKTVVVQCGHRGPAKEVVQDTIGKRRVDVCQACGFSRNTEFNLIIDGESSCIGRCCASTSFLVWKLLNAKHLFSKYANKNDGVLRFLNDLNQVSSI